MIVIGLQWGGLTCKQHEETVQDVGDITYIDCDGIYNKDVYNFQNLSNYT